MRKVITKPTSILMVILAIMFLGMVDAPNRPRVVVVDFYAGRDITRADVNLLSTMLPAFLQAEYEVMSLVEVLEEVDRIMGEQGFSDYTLTERQAEIVDSILDLSKIITGSINTQRRRYQLMATVIDVPTSTILTTVGTTGATDEPLRRLVLGLAQSLISEIQRSEVPVPQEVSLEDLPHFSANQRGVLINGVRWATSNVDIRTGTFTASPEIAGGHNRWGTRHTFGVGSTAASELIPNRGTWARNNPCPPGWRVPYHDEWESLIAAGSFWTTVNGVSGRIFGTAPNQIFLPAAGGIGMDRSMNHLPAHAIQHIVGEGQLGFYWARDAWSVEWASFRLRFSQAPGDVSVGVDGAQENLNWGMNVRCVDASDRVWVAF